MRSDELGLISSSLPRILYSFILFYNLRDLKAQVEIVKANQAKLLEVYLSPFHVLMNKVLIILFFIRNRKISFLHTVDFKNGYEYNYFHYWEKRRKLRRVAFLSESNKKFNITISVLQTMNSLDRPFSV